MIFTFVKDWVIPWLRRLVAQRRISLATGPLGFVVDKVALGQVSYGDIVFRLSASWHQWFIFVIHLSSKLNNFSNSKLCAAFWGCYVSLTSVVVVVVNIFVVLVFAVVVVVVNIFVFLVVAAVVVFLFFFLVLFF